MRFVFLGLTITSSWGNGHATTYRGLVRALDRMGHDVLFLEWDKPWYAGQRDLPHPPYGETELYDDIEDLDRRFRQRVRDADVVIVGSYVPEGVDVAKWAFVTARGPVLFYDIDTPVTLAAVARGTCEYLSREIIPRFDAYLSFTGGPTLHHLEEDLGARHAWPLYCSVDPEAYRPDPDHEPTLDLGYLGTYSDDRQPALDRLLVTPARRWPEGRFAVAGSKYPPGIEWPANVRRHEHLPPAEHAAFYNDQRFTLNVTRADMVKRGWSPSVRLFEAAACGTPIISDRWAGLDDLFTDGVEVLIADTSEDAIRFLRETDEATRRLVGRAARDKVLAHHTNRARARELVAYVERLLKEEVPAHG